MGVQFCARACAVINAGARGELPRAMC